MTENTVLFDKLVERRKKHIETLLDEEFSGIWRYVKGNYSSEAHFIHELLQNADDCGASYVDFKITEDGLYFKHNGIIRFTISDVDKTTQDKLNGTLGHINSITAIGNSNKVDQQKIGKFGIGFKAVFAYTNEPEVYDDNFCFKLKNYIVPERLIEKNTNRKKGETLFYFPFNNEEKPKEVAHREIVNKLKSLQSPLLFLKTLNIIRWENKKEKGLFTKEEDVEFFKGKSSDNQIIKLVNQVNNDIQLKRIWLFTKTVRLKDQTGVQKINVGFFLNDNNTINSDSKVDAYCFFPTKETTNLRFIIHAPFLLTDNRQNILAGNDWNKFLIEELATLATEALMSIRSKCLDDKVSYFGKSFVELLPYNEEDFSNINNNDRISFYPFYKKILALLRTEQILPGRNNIFYRASNSYWSTDKELTDLFSDVQVSQITNRANVGLIFTHIGQKNVEQNNKPLHKYLRSITNEILGPEKIIKNISTAFTENQSIKWLLKFYGYLSERDSYLKVAKEYPIILDNEGKAVIPYDKIKNHYNIFLPASSSEDFKTVNLEFLKYDVATIFFERLGLSIPDIKANYLKKILPKYEEDIDLSDKELISHTKALIEFYKSCHTEEFKSYVERLGKLPLFKGIQNNKSKDVYLITSNELYHLTENLHTYFEGYESVYFFDEKFYKANLSEEEFTFLIKILNHLGVSFLPRLKKIERYCDSNTLEKFNLLRYKGSYYKTLIDRELEGLENVMRVISVEKSLVIWQILLEIIGARNYSYYNSMVFEGMFTHRIDGRYSPQNIWFESTFIKHLRNNRWLYNSKIEKTNPKSIQYSDLAADYFGLSSSSSSSDLLIRLLEFLPEQVDPQLSDEQQEIYDIGKAILNSGYTEEQVIAAIAKLNTDSEIIIKHESVNEEFIHDGLNTSTTRNRVQKTIRNISERLNESFFENHNHKVTGDNIIVSPVIDYEQEEQEDISGSFISSIDLEDEYNKRIKQVQREVEELALVEQLKSEVVDNDKYTFGWFKALMELEYLNNSDFNSKGKEISISFSQAVMEDNDSKIIILSKPSRYIPGNIEDIGNLVLNIYKGRNVQQVAIEVVNVKEYSLHAKVKRLSDIQKIDFSEVSKVVIDIKNPIFLLEELRKNILSFSFEDDFNLKENLTEKIKFVFGPPGTGKTTYLATDEVIPLIKKNHNLKVLILTPTNKAADVLSSKIMEVIGNSRSYLDWLIRFGHSTDRFVAEELGEDFRKIDINSYEKSVVVSTIARFAYDFFLPEGEIERIYLREIKWDYIIIDEASMITLPNIINVLYAQRNANFVIAGDPFQITPISRIVQWQDENIYSLVQLNSFDNPTTEPYQYDVINRYTQYRSIPTIGNVYSNFTYGGKLLHHRKPEQQKKLQIEGIDFTDLNVIKFPVTKIESIFRPNSLDGSKYHIYSALFTVELVLKMVNDLRSKEHEFFKIGIICPYRAQSDIIEKLIFEQFISDEKVEIVVGTIHGFQGDQCDIIFTIFNPPLSIQGSEETFLNKHNILNVAISRARDYLFILMPDDHTHNIENLKKIKKIRDLSVTFGGSSFTEFSSQYIEKELFNSASFIYDNSFATGHQSVNIYSKPIKKYEVRCENSAVDIQIK
ncbi:AAA domain-containing protein [Chryseobacterium sp. S0630]|uniref:DEAD/DEAH box helicase n=1 Tax=Chryseobacterium sp. S0630 TaxID=2957803 RepID=UPI00209DC689|nr:AAA domain-containing protein [Chryseobacterium sp. S0630]MCP1301484.1 AAA domain-containing protein [Chryseobacterium sp. S0630]